MDWEWAGSGWGGGGGGGGGGEESHSGPFYIYISGLLFIIKLDGVGAVDNRPSMD